MKRFIGILVLSVFCLMLNVASADEKVEKTTIDIGFWSYHFDRTPPEDCYTETHNAVIVERSGWLVGGYKNTHCRQSFVLGTKQDLGYGFSTEVALISGYPSKMHVVDGIVIMPTINYRVFVEDTYGIKFLFVPTVLVGVGFTVKL